MCTGSTSSCQQNIINNGWTVDTTECVQASQLLELHQNPFIHLGAPTWLSLFLLKDNKMYTSAHLVILACIPHHLTMSNRYFCVHLLYHKNCSLLGCNLDHHAPKCGISDAICSKNRCQVHPIVASTPSAPKTDVKRTQDAPNCGILDALCSRNRCQTHSRCT